MYQELWKELSAPDKVSVFLTYIERVKSNCGNCELHMYDLVKNLLEIELVYQ